MEKVDYFSQYFEIDLLPKTHSHTIIECLKANCARHGIPDIMSDNSPQYASLEFKNFCASWGTEYQTSSPYNPKCNSRVEAAVKIAKNIIRKRTLSRDELQEYPT